MTVDPVLLIKWYLVFLFSTVFHEYAHAWTAWRLGDDTARQAGLVTLDPTPHLRRSPLGLAAVPLAAFIFTGWMVGWASTPFRPQWAYQYPRQAALMAMAGPAANLTLAVLAAISMALGVKAGLFTFSVYPQGASIVDGGTGWPLFFGSLLSLILTLNLLLGLFNLLPFPPLDGSRLVGFVLPGPALDRYWNVMSSPGARIAGGMIAMQISTWLLPHLPAYTSRCLQSWTGT